MLMVLAGIFSSRWWFVAVILPLVFLGMAPQYEQPTKIALNGNSYAGISFKLSGSFKVVSVGAYQYPADEKQPNDPHLMMWRIEAADPKNGGREAWELNTVRYGEVPDGYVQVSPNSGEAPPPLEPGTVYRVNADGFFGGFFKISNGKPQWVPTPSDTPCWAKQGSTWIRIACS
ncbi:MAG: hypothetical protein ABSE85_10175 [Candidatus Korobacteraceae bacterium]